MAATANSWMPASGKHSVTIGKSLGRALKARKGVASAAPKGGIPDKDFYSFRCAPISFLSSRHLLNTTPLFSDNFKPESIDSTKPGSIEIKTGRDSTTVTVERSSSQVSAPPLPSRSKVLDIVFHRLASFMYSMAPSSLLKSGNVFLSMTKS